MNALETEHSNLEIDSKLNRQPVKTFKKINDDVTCSCLGNEHTNRTAAFCTRWSLLRFVAATPYNRLLP